MVAEVEAVDKVDLRELLGTTEKGKEIYLVRKPNCSVRMIAFGSGGQLPAMLEGGYSSVQSARAVVASYLAKVAAKEIKDDGSKVKATGRSSK